MHQPINFVPAPRTAASDATLRQTVRRSIARDLMLPENHPVVSGMLTALAAVSVRRHRLVVDAESLTDVPAYLEKVSLDTWCCVVAEAAARSTAA